MMIFSSRMKPQAIHQNKGKPHMFTCDLCGAKENGLIIQPKTEKQEAWAILPEEWDEIEDRRPTAKKPFIICCSGSKCRHQADSYSH